MAGGGALRSASAAALIAASAALSGACGGARRAAPPAPAAEVRAQIDEAERAERARRHDVARSRYEQAVAAARDPASAAFARHRFAETLVSWGELDAARSQLEAAAAAAPGDAALWHDLGFARFQLGDGPGAISALERARELAPSHSRPRLTLAVVRWKLHDRAGAAAEYRALLALELSDAVRAKVEWALRELAKP